MCEVIDVKEFYSVYKSSKSLRKVLREGKKLSPIEKVAAIIELAKDLGIKEKSDLNILWEDEERAEDARGSEKQELELFNGNSHQKIERNYKEGTN